MPSDAAQIPVAPMPRKPGPRPKHGVPIREALPLQIAARVPETTFKQYAALRFALKSSNSDLLIRAAELIIKNLTPDQRKRYNVALEED
jgi:hypothetical protein